MTRRNTLAGVWNVGSGHPWHPDNAHLKRLIGLFFKLVTFQTCLSPHLLQSHCSDFLQHCHSQHQQVRGQLNDREAKDNTSIHTFLKHFKTLEIMQHFA